jgi:F0F1-type ATP synthase membrane subunit c/vacuolar-type H+-ATPase subunit K
MGEQLSLALEPLAEIFRGLGLPAAVTHWGHPFFMSIVMFGMGGYGAYAGWKGRLLRETDKEAAAKSRSEHSKIITAMTLFMAIGATGGILSLVMQKQPVMESPHFVTGMTVLFMLFLNASVSFSGFGGQNPALRKAHAYFGSAILIGMAAHAVAGLRLGLSI